MFAIIGIVVVFASVVGGFLLGKGNLLVLWQPNEFVIILGAAAGTILTANPLPTIKKLLHGVVAVVKGSRYTKLFYLEQLRMLNELFTFARKNGLVKLEGDIEEPHKSAVFKKFPNFLKDHHALHFLCDTMRMSISGGVGHFELDQMMELDMDVHHHEETEPVAALTTMADSLPGLGIVAAVLGVVITMGSLGGPPEEIGHHVAAALVGTFIGILMCYGLFGPIAANMAKLHEAEHQYYNFLRVGIISFIRGAAPILAVEFARRSIPAGVRPTFKEMETACRGQKAAAAA